MRDPPVARPLRCLESWGWPDQPQLIPKLLICGVLHVADSDLPPGPGTLHLGEVHAKFLGLALGGLRGVGLFLSAALCGILGLLCGLARSVLGLPGRLTGGVLGTLRGLPGLVCHLARCVLGLLGGPSGGVLSLLGSALGCILRSLRGLPCLVGNLPAASWACPAA